MRDLEGIKEINGPRRAELQAERARTVAAATAKAGDAADISEAHGKRLVERNDTPHAA